LADSRFGKRALGALFLALFSSAALGAGDAQAGAAKAKPCAECHGEGGRSTDPKVPSLAGQPPLYIEYQLIQYHDERRKDARMSPFAEKLSNADMKDLAAYFSTQQPAKPAFTPDPAKVAAGKAITAALHCNSCHRPDFKGQNHIARLTGQHYEYLVKELRGFKNGTRPDIDGMMASSAQPLTDDDIVNVAHYLASLDP